MDEKSETTDTDGSTPPDPSDKPSPLAMASIQGDLEKFQLYKEQYQAHEDHGLSNDLKKFQERPRPNFYENDPLKEETDVQIQEVNDRADLHGSSALEKMQQKDNGWEEPVKVMKDHGAGPYHTMAVMESFDSPPEVRKLEKDELHNRYVGTKTEHEGKFLTNDQFSTSMEAIDKLSLPDENSAEKKIQLKVDKGATIFEGRANHLNDHLGGGHQIYVVDDNRVHEVKE